ncbi:NAD kinase-like isoform X2 [Choristoneura fumiferana]|uniref:NAD kinase-like isoform X2 n=1 Tax=Choristoneura fumiferana TaxID=7141 RepID=UPI003D15EB1B
MLAMDSLWCGSESELSTLRLCKSTVEKSDYRLRRKPSKGSKSLIPQGLLHAAESQPRAVRRRRSGTWPRTRSLNAPSPIQQFGPCGRIMKNSAMVMQIQDPASQRLTWYKQPLTVLVIKKVHDATILTPFVQLVHWLVHDKSMVVYVEAAVLDDVLLAEYGDFTAVKERLMTFRAGTDDLTDKIDFIICLGGDGTLLHASSLFQQSVPPVMAFHLGSLGFLTPFQFNNFQEQVMNVLEGHAALTLRSRLQCVVLRSSEGGGGGGAGGRKCILVLNEVVVDRGPSPYLSNIDLFLDGKHITSVQGDGLIVSTPTGSTAYAVAAGASMIHPSVPAIMVTPICPHSLSFRPIVVPAGVELKITPMAGARTPASVSFDGRAQLLLAPGDSLYVTTSVYPVPSICAQDQISDWFDSLAECLHWNVRKKQKQIDELSDMTYSSSDNLEELENHNERPADT